VMGGPVGTRLIRRFGLGPSNEVVPPPPSGVLHGSLDEEIDTEPAGPPPTAYSLLQALTVVLVAMVAGGILSGWLGRFITLPGYVGAMICAVVIRNVGDATGLLRIEQRSVDDIGTIALALFLSMALMTLKLWELFGLALPMLVILAAQVALVGLFASFITYRAMGKDYDSAVMAGGHCGFALGATPNAVANMTALVERFGPAPRAFLVLPMVGAFFIDFTNALVITACVNLLR
jgi:glutamate:Na+ symporter, ESS family